MKKKLLVIGFIILINIICIDFVSAEQYNNYSNELFSCGNNLIDKAPATIPKIVSIGYNIIQVLIPILLIIFGLLDFIKAVMAQKEDDIKKGQQIFIKRLIAGVIVFFIFVVVKFFISLIADADSNDNILDCAECLLENNDKCIEVK